MSCVSYNTPPLNHKNAAEFNLYLKAFDENMRAAGLIRNNIPEGATYNDSFGAQPIFDYNYNAFEPFYSTLTVKQTSSWYNTQYLCSMEYKLPIGNGKIIFADDPAYPGYKKINQASYESTEVIIRFNFVLNSGVQSNVSNTLNQRYILCYPTIYTKDYFAIAAPGTGYSFYPHAGAGASDLTSNGQGRSGGESNILNEANTKLIYATGGAGGNYGSGGNSGGNSGEVFFNGTSISTKYNGGPGGSSGIYNGGAGAGAAPVNGNGGGAGKNIVGFGFDDIYFGGGGGAGPNSTNNIVIAGGYNTGGIGRNAEGGTPSTKGMTNGGGGGGGSWGGYNGTNGGGSGLVVIRYRL